MNPRAGGGLLLVVALVLVLAVPRVLNPPTLTGRASIEPPPPPPAVGTCLVDGSTGYGMDGEGVIQQTEPVQVVPCNDSHHSEVVYVEADVPPAEIPSDGPYSQPVMEACSQLSGGAWSYLGLPGPSPTEPAPPGEWSQYANFGLSLVGPSPDQRVRGARWVACVLVTLTTVDVPLQGIVVSVGGIPPELGACSADAGGSDLSAAPVDCTQPHRAEVVGSTNLGNGLDPETSASAAPTRSELTASCEALAVAATRRSQLLAESSLTAEVFAYVIDDDRVDVQVGEIPANAQGWAECVITTNPDRDLNRSLRLIGDGPLPWQP